MLPGHTEIFQDLARAGHVFTMFVVEKLRVFFYSRHVSLRNAIDILSEDGMVEYLTKMNRELKKIGFQTPKIAVAALNPHGSDDGLFGEEEEKILTPAVKAAKGKGLDIHGPIPADSVFHQGLTGKYDAILSLYHDQGHIACKTYDFERTVSVTLGLPFIRTSVDHGTAFDIAGQKIASPVSMKEAIFCCLELVERKNQEVRIV